MVAGRELDALVAENVMGCERKISTLDAERKRDPAGACWCGPAPYGGRTGRGGIHSASYLGSGTREIASYSTSIAAAWEVVEKLTPERHDRVTLVFASSSESGRHEATFWGGTDGLATALGDSIPHAICLAALRSVGASLPVTTPDTE